MNAREIDVHRERLSALAAQEARNLISRQRGIDADALQRMQGWTDLIVRTQATHAVTLVWNPKDGWLSAERIRIDVERLHCRIDRKLLKKNYNKKPAIVRTGYIGVIEHLSSNGHVHLAWRVPVAHHACFSRVLHSVWDHLNPYGGVDVGLIRSQENWASYITKTQWRFPRADDAELFLTANIVSL